MKELSFIDCKSEIIQELEILYYYDKNNYSYKYLIDKLLELTPDNVEYRKDQLLYFLVDSYDGEKKIRDKISRFLRIW